jgi:uncharacterized protein YkwD
MKRTYLTLLLLIQFPAHAGTPRQLADLINTYRTAPPSCQGKPARAAPAMVREPALSKIRLQPGSILIAALDRAGFDADYADAVEVSGPEDAQAAFDLIVATHCRTLLNRRFSAFGVNRKGNDWTVVLAQPAPDLTLTLSDWIVEGQRVLAATNAARASGQTCGDSSFPPAPPLIWNLELGKASLGHSHNMVSQRFFAHQDKVGNMPAERASGAGYAWRRIGENIGAGSRSAEEVVAGWVASPGHCANLMNPAFVEMGAAYAIRGGPRPSAYWTQMFGTR